MDIRRYSKAIGGALAGAAIGVPASIEVVQTIFPADVEAPWWAYLVAWMFATALGYFVPYILPRNSLTAPEVRQEAAAKGIPTGNRT